MKTRNRIFPSALVAALCLLLQFCGKPDLPEPLLTRDTLSDADLFWNMQAVDVGAADQEWLLVSGWDIRRETNNTTSAVVRTRTNAFLRFSTYSIVPVAISVRCRIEEGSAARLQVFINGTGAGSRAVGSEYKEIRYHVDPKRIAPGENSLAFKVLSGRKGDNAAISIDRIQFMHPSFPANESRPKIDATRGAAIRTPVPSKITVFKKIPAGARLYMKYGLAERSGTSNEAAQFRISIEFEDGSTKQLASNLIHRRFLSRSRATTEISLAEFNGQLAGISLEASPVEGYHAPAEVQWTRAEILSHPESADEKSLPQREQDDRRKGASKPNIILYLIDALRADSLQPYGYKKPVSPNIQGFSRESLVFENAYAQSAWTRASIASIFTGLYPSSHLVEGRYDRLSASLPTISTELKRHSYGTYGFITNGNVSRDFGFGKGFDVYQHLKERSGSKEIHVQSDELIATVDDFLETTPAQPFFLYVHATDPHEPYTPEPFPVEDLPQCAFDDPATYRASYVIYGKSKYGEDQLECVRALYDSEILKTDFYFGQFLNHLKERNLYDNSVILLTADHGEAFGGHGSLHHGQSLYEAEIRIPLLIRFPGEKATSKRISTRVRHIDILPTVLDYVSNDPIRNSDGTSLLPLLENHHEPSPPVFSELDLDIHKSKALILDDFKLLEIWRGPHHYFQLFYLPADPGEQNDLLPENPVRAGYMKALLGEWSRSQQAKQQSDRKEQATPDPETEEALRALGYLE